MCERLHRYIDVEIYTLSNYLKHNSNSNSPQYSNRKPTELFNNIITPLYFHEEPLFIVKYLVCPNSRSYHASACIYFISF